MENVLDSKLTGKRVSSVLMEACRTERGGYSGPPGEFILYSADCSRIWDVVRRGRPAGRDTWRHAVKLVSFATTLKNKSQFIDQSAWQHEAFDSKIVADSVSVHFFGLAIALVVEEICRRAQVLQNSG
jgi:hypothetical protein